MADEENLVSEVKIEGVQATTDDLKKLGDEGAAAFDKLAAAAENVGEKTKPAAKGLDQLAGSADKAGTAVEGASKDISKGLTNLDLLKIAATATGNSLAQFATKSLALGAALVTGVVGIAKFANSTTFAYRELFEQQNRNVQQTRLAGKASVQAAGQANSYNDSVDDLTKSLYDGTIGYAEYGKALKDLDADFRRQEANIKRVQQAQEDAQKKNELAQRAEEQRIALKALTDVYGGPLTTSLISLGKAYKDVSEEARDAFSPVLAKFIDLIGSAIDRNADAISSFIDDAAEALDNFITQNGASIEKFFTRIIEIARGFGTVFVEYVIPKLEMLMTVLDQIATAINTTFGTELTGGLLLAYAAVIKLTGGFNLLMTVGRVLVLLIGSLIASFGIVPVLIGAAAIALAAWLYTVDWVKLGTEIKTAFQAFITFFQELPGRIGTFFSELWESIKTKAGEAVQWVIDKFNALIEFFRSIPGIVGQFFIDLWEGVKQKTQEAFDWIGQLIQSWKDKVLGWLGPILRLMEKIIAKSKEVPGGDGGGGGSTVTAAGGGHIRGPGTATSDSIPAWLSNNEYVVRARAVAKYGVGFMNAINSGRFKMPKFAEGGINMITPGPSARFAGEESGGADGNMRPLNLSLFGESFEGLMMPENVANRMAKFAISRQTRSAGRKPSWVGGTR